MKILARTRDFLDDDIIISHIAQGVESPEELLEISKSRGWTEDQLESAQKERFGHSTVVEKEQSKLGLFSQYCDIISADWGKEVSESIEENVRETYERLNWKNEGISQENRSGYGLVVGRIQSGKTAHIIGLSMLALDTIENQRHQEYNTIIILSGLIEDLRKQTFGRISKLGMSDIRIFPKKADFAEKNLQAKEELLDALCKVEPCILVVKKNHKVIEAILEYLDQPEIRMQLPERRILLIDDECDHASVDSGHAESNEDRDEVTATNRAVRRLILSLQDSKQTPWYIGYTATPYSNLLMHPEPEFIQIADLGPSLFPRDMIHLLPNPEGHHDNEFFFNGTGAPYIQEKEIPAVGGSEERQHLRLMLVLHVASKILRDSSGTVKAHTTMIHTDTETGEHTRIAEIIRQIKEDEFDDIGDSEALELIIKAGKEYYPEKLDLLKTECEEIIQSKYLSLKRFFIDTDIVLLNADPEKGQLEHPYPSELDYDDEYEISIIVIGGHKLSRGLTLEGLTISWFARVSEQPNYDTLLQMARWCGYRSDFLDLIRIFMNEDTIQHYQFITEVERRLRIDLKKFTKHTNPLDEIQWIRQYHGMSISGKLPDNLTQNPSSNLAILSEFILDELPDNFSNEESNIIQRRIFEAFEELRFFHGGEFRQGQGEFEVADTSYSRIRDFIQTYADQYGKKPESKKHIDSLIQEISENEELQGQWSLSIHSPGVGVSHPECDLNMSQLGFKRGNKNFISQPETTAVSDLPIGTSTRVRPMLCIFVEDPSVNIAGIPTYNNNAIPIIIIGFFIPPESLPAAFIEIARPGIGI